MKKASLAAVFALFVSLPILAAAAVPQTLAFAARIGDNGRPVAGAQSFTFKLWTVATGGTAGVDDVWTEGPRTITVTDGVVNTALGDVANGGTALPLFDGTPLWLEVTMGPTVFAPRIALQAVPYALRAAEADHATTATSATTAGSAATAAIATGVAMKTSGFLFTSVCATASCVGSLGSITLTVPTAGSVFLTGSGFCNVPTNLGFELDIGFSTAATTLPLPVSNWWVYRTTTSTTNPSGVPLQAARTFPIAAGTSTFFLTAQPLSAISANCSGNIVATFVPSPLP